MMPRSFAMRNIQCRERYGAPAYVVYFHWMQKVYWKHFGYGEYGGKTSARTAAQEWRDETMLRIGKPLTSRKVIVPRNGLKKVYKVKSASGVCATWVVSPPPKNGKRASRTAYFGRRVYGDDVAQAALAARERQEIKLYGIVLPLAAGNHATR